MLAQIVACLPLDQRFQGLISGKVKNFLMEILNLEARKGEM